MAAAAQTSTPPAGGGKVGPAKSGGGQEAMLPAELGELLEGDERLSQEDLRRLSLFRSEEFEKEKNIPNFERFSGTSCLRRCEAGRVICRQGEAGSTAFYILTTEDVLALRRGQRETFEQALRELTAGQDSTLLPEFEEGDPQEHLAALTREIEELEQRLKTLPPPGTAGDHSRAAATVVLTPALETRRKPPDGLRGFFDSLFGRKATVPVAAAAPRSIAIDAPVGLQSQQQFQATLHEGQLFGEMSCLNRTPRSATVVATRECYLLEVLRNVLDMLHKDPKFKARIDQDYRKRVLETDVRRLEHFGEVFDRMRPEEFLKIQERVELVEFPAGSVIMEEGGTSNAVYIVRSGLAKVIKNGQYTLRGNTLDAQRWNSLTGELAALGNSSESLATAVWQTLSPAGQELAMRGGPLDPAGRETLLDALNQLLERGAEIAGRIKVGTRAVKYLEEILELINDPQVTETLAAFPPEIENWSEYEGRVFGRVLLEVLCPRGIPRRLDLYGPPMTVNYLGRGEVLGEMGVLTGEPRRATVIAYDHPDGYNQRVPDSRMGAVPSRIELLRLGKDLFDELLVRFPELRAKFDKLAEQRAGQNLRLMQTRQTADSGLGVAGSEFERLGLVQGQRLMLIDLDRCTRCGACVEACVDAHDDGFSRLYLDGMRFDRYLVPLTCRSCLDPVCMIGCPVGSIQRGSNLQIEIKNWCIGCAMCADQCPYGSIQLNPIESIQLSQQQQQVLPAGVELKQVDSRAVVCDLCSSHSGGQPMCVYSCPHDAAHRVSGRDLLLDAGLFSPGTSPN